MTFWASEVEAPIFMIFEKIQKIQNNSKNSKKIIEGRNVHGTLIHQKLEPNSTYFGSYKKDKWSLHGCSKVSTQFWYCLWHLIQLSIHMYVTHIHQNVKKLLKVGVDMVHISTKIHDLNPYIFRDTKKIRNINPDSSKVHWNRHNFCIRTLIDVNFELTRS